MLIEINLYYSFSCKKLWDMELLIDTCNSLPLKINEINGGELPIDKGAIVIIPGDWTHNERLKDFDNYSYVIDRIRQLPFALILHTSDECRVFDSSFLRSNKIKTWVQNNYEPNKIASDRNILFSYTPETLKFTKKFKDENRDNLWSFSGQITHEKRQEFATEARKRSDGVMVETDGFAKGLGREDYFKLMCKSKIVLCPSGPVSPEVFRLYEAIECGCLPIADRTAPNWDRDRDYWQEVLGEKPPFPTVSHWIQVHDWLDFYKERPLELSIRTCRVQSWWLQYKTQLRIDMMSDLQELANG